MIGIAAARTVQPFGDLRLMPILVEYLEPEEALPVEASFIFFFDGTETPREPPSICRAVTALCRPRRDQLRLGQLPLPLIDAVNRCLRRVFWYSWAQYCDPRSVW